MTHYEETHHQIFLLLVKHQFLWLVTNYKSVISEPRVPSISHKHLQYKNQGGGWSWFIKCFLNVDHAKGCNQGQELCLNFSLLRLLVLSCRWMKSQLSFVFNHLGHVEVVTISTFARGRHLKETQYRRMWVLTDLGSAISWQMPVIYRKTFLRC